MTKKEKPKMTDTIKNVLCAIAKPYGINILELLKDKMTSTKKYMSIKEAERYSSLSRWTLWRAIKKGKLPAKKLSQNKSGRVLISS
jgi:predicted DNA-binding transcriptional regulator AlpA